MDYRGPYRIRAVQKAEPKIEHPEDCIVRVTRSCICGSDLHLYHGFVPDTRVGSTFGHEFIGIVEEIGPSVENLKIGDHVIVPFNISCGRCAFCKQDLYGNCHESNPEATGFSGILIQPEASTGDKRNWYVFLLPMSGLRLFRRIWIPKMLYS